MPDSQGSLTCASSSAVSPEPKSLKKDRPSQREGNSLHTRQMVRCGARKFLGSDFHCSSHVARGSKMEMREEREGQGMVGALSFSICFLIHFYQNKNIMRNVSQNYKPFLFQF
jgi:hypothetical protein